MKSLPLRLRACSVPLPVAAGWLASPDAESWLREARRICEANARAVVKFYPLAVSLHDHAVSGVIITVSGAEVALEKIFGPQVQRLGMAVPGVLVPVNSRLEPALTAEEQRRLFPWPVQFVHPVLGVTGFDEADAITPEQLLAPPAVERMAWYAAVPGPVEPPPLLQITLLHDVSLEELMAGEGGDIASQRPDKIKKPGAPGSGLLDRAAGAAGSAIGALGAGALRAFGAGRAADRLAQWSRRQWEEVMDRRKKELNRLLDRFDKDLLEALRHAIPLTGAESRRGTAPQPGWRLGARSMNLDSRSHGSGPVDVWNIENDMRLKLERRYRDAAAREAGAGHWGRAAYIYGELLGDWNMAAQMLEKAGRPREAARIYLDRLRSGARAAACLEKAGLLAEAAALYREAGMHEKAGDLLAALGQEKAAREQWQLALQRLASPLDQAKLLETKLGDPDRALFVLDRAWPGTPHAQACFEEEFALLGRHERHAEAAEVLARLERNPRARLSPVTATVTALRSVFRSYPDSAVNARAAELALQFSGEFLAREPQGTSAKQLLALLPQFAPGDRIISRDVNRFSIGHNKPAVPLLMRGGKTLRSKEVVELVPAFEWTTAWHSLAACEGGLSAVGTCYDAKDKVTLYFRWLERPDGRSYAMGERVPDFPGKLEHIVCPHSTLSAVFLHRGDRSAFWVGHEGRCEIKDTLALGRSDDEFLLLCHKATAGLVAETYGADGGLRRSRVLDLAPPEIKNSDWFAGGHGEDIWVAGPSVACCVNGKIEFQQTQLNGPVTCLAIAPPVLSSQAIAIASGEAVLLIPRGQEQPMECVNLWSGTGGVPPVATFTRDGRAVIADARGGVVYALRKSCAKAADIVIPPGSGDLISAAPYGTQGFAFLTGTGKVLIYGG